MESAKHGNSETSSDTKVNDDDTTGTGRSYECTFCRRGFTNAQALGGHMNIHRKDKAKAKAKAKQQLSTHDSPASNYYAPLPISSEKPHHYAALGDQMMNYDQFYNFPASNPSFVPYPYGHHVNDHLPVSRSEPAFSGHEEKNMGVNLSLQISPPHMEDSREKKKGMKENEVDLELRLGH